MLDELIKKADDLGLGLNIGYRAGKYSCACFFLNKAGGYGYGQGNSLVSAIENCFKQFQEVREVQSIDINQLLIDIGVPDAN